jgi:hypothetical protein
MSLDTAMPFTLRFPETMQSEPGVLDEGGGSAQAEIAYEADAWRIIEVMVKREGYGA